MYLRLLHRLSSSNRCFFDLSRFGFNNSRFGWNGFSSSSRGLLLLGGLFGGLSFFLLLLLLRGLGCLGFLVLEGSKKFGKETGTLRPVLLLSLTLGLKILGLSNNTTFQHSITYGFSFFLGGFLYSSSGGCFSGGRSGSSFSNLSCFLNLCFLLGGLFKNASEGLGVMFKEDLQEWPPQPGGLQ